MLAPTARASEETRESTLGPVEVFGAGVETLSRPLEPAKVDRRKVETYQYTDVNRALKNSSGVYVREEEGQGLRPNIGLRGTNPDRSKKIVLMQDGVLISPAPYSAPAAYYTPSMNHTESMEVFKGFAGVPYGPNSIGGAVNFLSSSIPFDPKVRASGTYGSFETLNTKVGVGGPLGDTSRLSYLIEGSRIQTEGFKQLDTGDTTGFEQNHLFLKLNYQASEKLSLLLTAGYSDENSHETYLGLSQTDFNATPYRRYTASALDDMVWRHTTLHLRGVYQLKPSAALETTLYRHDFDRTWYRLDRFRDNSLTLRDVLNNPAANDNYLRILRGELDSAAIGSNGQLLVVRNHRIFFSQGLQTRFSQEIEAGEQKHSLEFNARLHEDSITRRHTGDYYDMVAGEMTATATNPTVEARNRDSARALSLSAFDNWQVGSWTFTPVARYESVQFYNRDDMSESQRSRSDRFWVPGFAVTKRFWEKHSLRGSVNKAVTASGLSTTGDEQREEATNYEVEWRLRDPEKNQEVSLTGFVNDYRNITGTCSLFSGCGLESDIQTNGGRARVQGLELSAAKGFQTGPIYIPVQASVTLMSATFQSTFTASSADWGSGEVRPNDSIPYIPRRQYLLSTGLEYQRFKQDISFVYQSAVYDQAVSSGRKEIPAYGIIDWAAEYSLTHQMRLRAKVENILNREYAVSNRPFGLRPGKPQTFTAGLMVEF